MMTKDHTLSKNTQKRLASALGRDVVVFKVLDYSPFLLVLTVLHMVAV